MVLASVVCSLICFFGKKAGSHVHIEFNWKSHIYNLFRFPLPQIIKTNKTKNRIIKYAFHGDGYLASELQ
jgi:hypothetical protein